MEIRSPRVRKGTLVILWLSDRPEPDRPDPDRTWTGPGPEWHTRSKGFSSWIMDHGSWIKDHGSKIKNQRSMIKYQWSKIKYHGSKIKYQVSSIKYQVSSIKDQGSRIKDQGSRILDLGPWTWHEWPSQTGYQREIKTIRIYYQRSIILNRFYMDPIK